MLSQIFSTNVASVTIKTETVCAYEEFTFKWITFSILQPLPKNKGCFVWCWRVINGQSSSKDAKHKHCTITFKNLAISHTL